MPGAMGIQTGNGSSISACLALCRPLCPSTLWRTAGIRHSAGTKWTDTVIEIHIDHCHCWGTVMGLD